MDLINRWCLPDTFTEMSLYSVGFVVPPQPTAIQIQSSRLKRRSPIYYQYPIGNCKSIIHVRSSINNQLSIFHRQSPINYLCSVVNQQSIIRHDQSSSFLSFKSVESQSIDTDDGTLRHEGGGVYLVYQAEDFGRFALASQHEEHLHLFARIETLAVDDGATAHHIQIDGMTDFLMLVGNDEKLHRPAHHVHHPVHAYRRHEKHHVTVNHLFPIAEHEIARRHHAHIAHHNGMAQRDIMILVDHRRDDIRPARASVARESHAHAAAQKTGAHHGGHERLVVEQMRTSRERLQHGDASRKHEHGIDGLDAEFESENAQRKRQQHHVEHQIGDLNRYAEPPIEDGRNTGQTAQRDMVR
jgi:hypothetical protein